MNLKLIMMLLPLVLFANSSNAEKYNGKEVGSLGNKAADGSQVVKNAKGETLGSINTKTGLFTDSKGQSTDINVKIAELLSRHKKK